MSKISVCLIKDILLFCDTCKARDYNYIKFIIEDLEFELIYFIFTIIYNIWKWFLLFIITLNFQ